MQAAQSISAEDNAKVTGNEIGVAEQRNIIAIHQKVSRIMMIYCTTETDKALWRMIQRKNFGYR